MPPRLTQLALLSAAALAAAGAGGACFSPVPTAKSPDTGAESSDAADAGPSNLDGSCPLCLPACEPSCTGEDDAGCYFETRTAFAPGCAPTTYSLAVGWDTDGGLEQAASLCACGETWATSGSANDDWGESELVFSICARSVVRSGPNGEQMIVVNDPLGTVRLFERRSGGGYRQDEPPQIRAPATLVIDSAGNPHLAGLGQGAILHLARVEGAWSIDSAANAGSERSGLVLLALGPDGLPRIAHSPRGDVELATLTGAGWEHSTASGMGEPLSLQVDAEGRAHLLYLFEGLRYAMQTPDGWVSEIVDAKATAGVLALAAGGCPRAVWSADGLYYGERTAGGWTSQRVSDDTFGIADEPFALLPDRRPLILHGAAAMSVSSR